MADEEIMTIGELGRLIRSLAAEVREDRRNYLALQVWEVEKAALERQIGGLGREIGQLRSTISNMETAKEHEHKEINASIAAQKETTLAAAEQSRKDRAKIYVSIGLAVFVGIIGVITGVATQSLNQIINGG